jgi:nitrate reductase assembly molybdenum cofactor insertion protein NarJ
MDELKHSVFDMASPYTSTFDESKRDKKIFFAYVLKTRKEKRGRGVKYITQQYHKNHDINYEPISKLGWF